MTPEYYIGLMSGTSMDAVDCALVDLGSSKPVVRNFRCFEFPVQLRKKLDTLVRNSNLDLNNLGSTDVEIGKLFADCANAILRDSGIAATDIKAIGSHGQTVWHHPQSDESGCPFTLQIGDPNTIAHLTGITTIADFRRHDVAAGGQGAPLVPAFHNAIFRSDTTPRVVLNLGGFANITVLNPDTRRPFGYDTGPANVLLDEWIRHTNGVDYDDKGAWSLTGTIIPTLLQRMLAEPYLALSHPKSTGRELFNLSWLLKHLAALETQYAPADVQATLLELSAASISSQITRHLRHGEVLTCGGGVHNDALLASLARKLPGFHIMNTEHHGLHPDQVEAVAFAWFAQQTLNGRAIDFSPFTGASKPVIAGGIYRV